MKILPELDEVKRIAAARLGRGGTGTVVGWTLARRPHFLTGGRGCGGVVG